MTCTLREARCHYTSALAYIIGYAVSIGFEVALDEGKSSVGHMKGSTHEVGLGQDILLYRPPTGYLKDTEDYKPVGLEWERYGEAKGWPLRWGGRFNDGNHFSWEWNGVK